MSTERHAENSLEETRFRNEMRGFGVEKSYAERFFAHNHNQARRISARVGFHAVLLFACVWFIANLVMGFLSSAFFGALAILGAPILARPVIAILSQIRSDKRKVDDVNRHRGHDSRFGRFGGAKEKKRKDA